MSVVERFGILAIASFIIHKEMPRGGLGDLSLWELLGVKFCPLFGVIVQS
jgi:hypothetical protein